MDELFRSEAVQAHRPQLFGAVRLATPVSHQIWGLAAVVMTAAIVLWLSLGHYTRREHVIGALVPQEGLLNITARDSGTVAQLDVSEGAHVSTGEALLTISGDRSSVAMGDTGAVVSAQLRSQESQLRATLAGLRPQADTQAKDLRARIGMLRTQLVQIRAQRTLQRKQADTAVDLLKKIGPLHLRGVVSTVAYDQYESQALSLQEQVKELERRRLDTAQQISSLTAQLAQLPLDTAAKANQLRGQLSQLDASLAQNEAQRDTVSRAPVAGTVSAVLIKPGQAVSPGQSLLAIMPEGSVLQAQLLVPSSAIGFVHAGTPVVLHYQAFPYQKFGVQHGTVVAVSRSALTPDQITTLLGQQPPSQPMYRVEVKLLSQSIKAYGKQRALLPGMTLEADLLLDRRRMIEWIFEPLYGMGKRGGGDND